jgi:hypothetical protein
MSPIIGARGGLSASAYGLFSASAAIVGDYQSIATVTVGSGGSSSISFTSIPSTFKHLQIRIMGLGNTAASGLMRFNSDTSSNYSWHALYGDGASAAATAETSTGFVIGNGFGSGPSSSTIPFVTVTDVLDYASTSKNKTVRSLDATDKNGSGYVVLLSGNWRNNTTAISTITIAPNSGNYTQYSSFALYGIKG